MALTKATFSMIEGASANVLDFGADPTGSTDSTAAIQAALDSGAGSVYLPEGTYLFSTLTVNENTRLHGASTRTSILKHTGAGTAIQCTYSGSTEPDGNSAYIDSGWFIFEDFELLSNGTFAFKTGKTRSSLTQFNRLYIRDRNAGSSYSAGTVGIDCDNTPWASTYATYICQVNHCVIWGFETAVNLQDTVNGWDFKQLYVLQCKDQIVLSTATTINISNCYFESNIAGAYGVKFLNSGNTFQISNSVFEFTNVAATQYAYGFAGASWTTVTVIGVKYLIQGDGNAINNRRYTGTIPKSYLEVNRTYTSSTYGEVPMLWNPSTSATTPFQIPNYSRVGGLGQGNGAILFGRNDSDAANGGVYYGAGSPEGVVTAMIGSLFLNSTGGAGTSLYVKESGTGNTGWVAK